MAENACQWHYNSYIICLSYIIDSFIDIILINVSAEHSSLFLDAQIKLKTVE
jgi:hypothetical protein